MGAGLTIKGELEEQRNRENKFIIVMHLYIQFICTNLFSSP